MLLIGHANPSSSLELSASSQFSWSDHIIYCIYFLAVTCGALMNGISARIKKTPESSLAPSII